MLARTFAVACAAAAALAATAARADSPTEPATAWALASVDADPASAGGATGKDQKKLGTTAEAQAGVVLARGNTDTTTANAKFEIVRTTSGHKDDLEIDGLYGKTGGIVTAERWETNLQRDWNLSSRTYWFVDFHYEHDLFSGFAYQGDLATGAGYKFIDSAATTFDGQIGVGYRRLRPETLTENALGEVTSRVEGSSEGQAVGVAKLDFVHSFNAQTKITDTLSGIPGAANTYLENDLALNVKLNGSLSLALGYTIRNNSNPPGGLLHTDTLTTLNLVYTKK
jgi:putative salt-induced outer membrane protein